MWVHKIILPTFINFHDSTFYTIYYSREIFTLIQHLIDHITQVTEYKYAIPVLKYNPSCDGV